MKKLSFVVVSTFVLAFGLRTYAQQSTPASQQTKASAPAAQARAATAGQDAPAPQMAVGHNAAPASITESQTALVKQYCATCHNDRNKNNAGGLTLASFDASKVGHDAEVAETAEKMIRKLRSGMMPPPQARRPEGTVLADFAASMEARLDQAAILNPNPGHRPFQRLNRAEYSRAVSALLNLDVDVNA